MLALGGMLGAQRNQSQKLSRTSLDLTLLKQQVEMKKAVCNDLQARMSDTKLSGELNTASVQVLDRALIPKNPIRPRTFRIVTGMIPLGLALGAGLAFLLNFLDRRVKSPQDVAKVLKLPLLTVVPGIGLGKVIGKGGKAKLVTVHEPRSHAAECYRNLRTSILFSSGSTIPKVILVTSAVAGEGKSTTAANLAVVMAQSGRRVLLADADLRRPALRRYFLHRENRGLVKVLSGRMGLYEAVQHSEIPGLDLLLCHSIPDNPSELLGSDLMRVTVEDLKHHYDTIVIDSPIVTSVPDARILAAQAEAVVMVHCPTSADRDMVCHALEKLEEVNAKILGLVMNNVDIRKSGYQYSHYVYSVYGT